MRRLISLTTLIIIFAALAAYAGPQDWGQKAHRPCDPVVGQLTEEQREEFHSEMRALRESGATNEEMQVAAIEKLTAYGIEVPEDWQLRGKRHHGHAMGSPIMSQLTEEQREEFRTEMRALCQSGATRQERQSAARSRLESYGVDVPEGWELRHRPHRPPRMRMIMSQVTDGQRLAIETKIQKMHQQGASRQEVRIEVNKMLEEYGVELPDGCRSNKGNTQANPTGKTGAIGAGGESGLTVSSYPNPSNPETTIVYELQDPEPVTLAVYDIQGQRVRTLVDGYQTAGSYEMVWNGQNDNGDIVSSGMYFYTLTAGDQTETHQIILMK